MTTACVSDSRRHVHAAQAPFIVKQVVFYAVGFSTTAIDINMLAMFYCVRFFLKCMALHAPDNSLHFYITLTPTAKH